MLGRFVRLACLNREASLKLFICVSLSILSCVFISFSFEAMAKSSNSYSVQRILERYKESLGGSRSVAALSSLSIEGYQIQDGTSYQFLMRKKRPNSIRYRLTAHETSVVLRL